MPSSSQFLTEINQLTSCGEIEGGAEDSRYNILYESTDEALNSGGFTLREWDIMKENSVADVLMKNNNLELWM